MKIEFEKVMEFSFAVGELRHEFPEFAREIDKLHFAVGKNFIPCCGHEKCHCKMTFEDFHARRNTQFGTTSEAKSYEFN